MVSSRSDRSPADFLFQRIVVSLVEFRRRDFALFLAHSGDQIFDGGANFLDFGVAKFNRVDDNFFADLFRAGLDHHDEVGGSDDHDVQRAFTHFVVGGIDYELSVELADAYRADRSEKWNIGKS